MYDYENQNQNNTNEQPKENYYTTGNFSGAYSGSSYDSNPNNKKPKKEKKEKSFAKKLAVSLSLGLAFGIAAGAAFSVPTYFANKELLNTKAALEAAQHEQSVSDALSSITPSISTTTDSIEKAEASNLSSKSTSSIESIATSCLPSVVSITNKGVTEVNTMWGKYTQDTTSSGSGIIIGKNDSELLIVTNYHVVSGSNELSVVFSYDENSENPSVVSAKIKGYASDKDLAVISVQLSDITDEMMSEIKIATLGDSSALQLGEQVVAIGNALGYGQSVTTGIISALNREVTVEGDDGTPITNKLIQTDAAINPGNSGGALLNMNGELVGINSVKVSNSSVEGMGYAIPISDVSSIIAELMIKETRDVVDAENRGYIGIQGGQDVTSDISEAYGIPVGVYISSVYDGSPAATAGLQKGYIITKVDGNTVKTFQELKTLLTYYKAGETIEIIASSPSAEGYTSNSYYVTLGKSSIFGSDADNVNPKSGSQQQTPNNGDNGNNNQSPYSGNNGNSGNSFFNFFWPF